MTTPALRHQNVQSAPARRLPLLLRLFTYLFLYVVVNLIANLARVGLDAAGLPGLISRLAFTLIYIAGVLGLTYLYRRSVDKRPWSGIALGPLSGGFPSLAVGLAVGVAIAALMFGFEYSAGWIRVIGAGGSAGAAGLIVDSLLVAAAFGACEEIAMRGYLFQNLSEGRPLWLSALMTGLIFGAFHLLSVGFGVRGASFFIFALVLNAFLVLTRRLTGSLWMAIGFHAAFDAAAINLGLGSVVLADQHLVQVERVVGLPFEDLLGAALVGMGALILIALLRRGPRLGAAQDMNA